MDEFCERRARMVCTQIEDRGIHSHALLAALRAVPRERFVDAELADFAYDDAPLPIGAGQTISQPYIVAAMIEAADVKADDTVLEIGAGSGYTAAVLSRLVAQVKAIERVPTLARAARQRLTALGCANVELREGDGSAGWPGHQRFDAIIVSAGGPEVPAALREQLVDGGRLLMPVGGTGEQRLIKLTRRGSDGFDREDLAAVAFVPLIGEHGWRQASGADVATRRD